MHDIFTPECSSPELTHSLCLEQCAHCPTSLLCPISPASAHPSSALNFFEIKCFSFQIGVDPEVLVILSLCAWLIALHIMSSKFILWSHVGGPPPVTVRLSGDVAQWGCGSVGIVLASYVVNFHSE